MIISKIRIIMSMYIIDNSSEEISIRRSWHISFIISSYEWYTKIQDYYRTKKSTIIIKLRKNVGIVPTFFSLNLKYLSEVTTSLIKNKNKRHPIVRIPLHGALSGKFPNKNSNNLYEYILHEYGYNFKHFLPEIWFPIYIFSYILQQYFF